jgi:hypothetical protein
MLSEKLKTAFTEIHDPWPYNKPELVSRPSIRSKVAAE